MVQRVIDFAANPPSSHQSDIGLGLYVFAEEQNITFASWEADLPTAQWPQITDHLLRITYHDPSVLHDLKNGWRLTSEIISDIAEALETAKKNPDPSGPGLILVTGNPLSTSAPVVPGTASSLWEWGGNR